MISFENERYKNVDTVEVSVITPTYNREKDVIALLHALEKQTFHDIEFIIVDNASTDDTKDEVIGYYEDSSIPVKLICLERNLMAAGGRNAGMKAARGNYFLLIDNDNIPAPDMIEQLLKVFHIKKNVGFAAPVSLNGDKIWMLSGKHDLWTSRPVPLGSGISYKANRNKINYLYETYLSPNASMIKREVYENVGGFDRRYFAMYEESDFGYRIYKKGYKMYICTKAVTHHMGTKAEGQSVKLRQLGIESPERAYHFAKNRFLFEKKFASPIQYFVFSVFFSWIFTVYYSSVARKEGRNDIARAYIKGAGKGFLKSL